MRYLCGIATVRALWVMLGDFLGVKEERWREVAAVLEGRPKPEAVPAAFAAQPARRATMAGPRTNATAVRAAPAPPTAAAAVARGSMMPPRPRIRAPPLPVDKRPSARLVEQPAATTPAGDGARSCRVLQSFIASSSSELTVTAGARARTPMTRVHASAPTRAAQARCCACWRAPRARTSGGLVRTARAARASFPRPSSSSCSARECSA